MKVLVIGRSYPMLETGMFGTFEYDQAKVLKRAGFDVRFYFHDTRPVYRLHRLGGHFSADSDGMHISGDYVPVGHMPRFLYDSLKIKAFKKSFTKVLDEFNPDIVHLHYPSIVLNSEMWDYMRGKCKKIVLTEHYTKVMTGQLPAAKLNDLSKIYAESDAVICVSEALAVSVRDIGKCDNVVVVPNVVSPDISSGEKPGSREDCVFSYIGRIAEVKQVDKLVQAFAALCKTKASCRLNVVGEGPRQRRVKRLAKELGVAEKISFYGNVSRQRVGEILLESDYCVTATRLETFCVPIIEAWCCGIPTVVPDSIPVLQYTSADNSIVFRDSDVNSLTEAMAEAVDKRGQFDREKIMETAGNCFGEESVSRQLTTVYNSILEK